MLKNPVYYKTTQKCISDAYPLQEREELYLLVCASVLISYVTWILSEAIKSGKQRLYFMARDGYQMYVAAEYLCNAWNLNIECRYLYVSRYAVRVPEYALLQEQCLERICVGGIDVTFHKIMRRAALTEEESRQIASKIGYNGREEQILNYQQVLALKQTLKEQKDFFRYVYAHSVCAYDGVMAYFEQEGLLEQIDYALVDSGWIGTMQQSIENLLRTKQPERCLEGYYFGMYECPAKANRKRYHSYYFSPESSIYRKVYFSNSLFETIFSAPHGMTIGYKKTGGKCKAILDVALGYNEENQKKSIELLKVYLQEYTKLVPEYEAINGVGEKNRKLVENLLVLFMGRPSMYEVQAYGQDMFSDDVLEEEVKTVAAQLSGEDIRNQRFWSKVCIMLGLKKGVIHESAWVEGSIVKNGKHVKGNLRHAAVYKYMLYLRKLLQQKKRKA